MPSVQGATDARGPPARRLAPVGAVLPLETSALGQQLRGSTTRTSTDLANTAPLAVGRYGAVKTGKGAFARFHAQLGPL